MKYKTNPLIIILATVIIVAAIDGGIFFWQKQTSKNIPAITSDQSSTSTNAKHFDNAKANCSQYGTDWIGYELDEFSFCYKTSWGTPEQEENPYTVKGKLFRLTFVNDKSGSGADLTPMLWWETNDLIPPEGDVSSFCFECINFSQSSEKIIEALKLQKQGTTVQKVKIDGKNAIRVHGDYYYEDEARPFEINNLSYYVPNAFGNYHLQALIDYNRADELDSFMKSISFD